METNLTVVWPVILNLKKKTGGQSYSIDSVGRSDASGLRVYDVSETREIVSSVSPQPSVLTHVLQAANSFFPPCVVPLFLPLKTFSWVYFLNGELWRSCIKFFRTKENWVQSNGVMREQFSFSSLCSKVFFNRITSANVWLIELPSQQYRY